jgi:hypothetical protein
VLVTCVYVVSTSTPWVEQSLFLAAIGDARDKGAKALEAFAYRYPEGESTYERFLVHRTVFPRDFLADFGFTSVRPRAGRAVAARARWARAVADGKRATVLRVVKEAFAPRHRCLSGRNSAATGRAGVGELEPATGTNRQSNAPEWSVSRRTPNVRSLTTSLAGRRRSTG